MRRLAVIRLVFSFALLASSITTATAQYTVDASANAPRRLLIKLSQEARLRIGPSASMEFSDALRSAMDDVSTGAARPLLEHSALRKAAAPELDVLLLELRADVDVEAARRRIEAVNGVEYVEVDKLYRVHAVPNDSAWSAQWGPRRVGLPAALDVTRGKADIVVGVIDTGIDHEHPDLRHQLWINRAEDANGDGMFQPWPSTEAREGVFGDFDGVDNDGNGFVDDVIGWDFVDQPDVSNAAGGDYRDPDPFPFDDMGHGSNVSGIIAAETDNGIGIAGIAPGCRLMTLRAFDARGVGAESDVARALAYAVANGARVINMSFGDVVYSRVLRDVIRYAYARGVVMVASAGNAQSTALHYPSAYDETISVSATVSNDLPAGFSNYGPTIDIAAPGSDILTTHPGGGYTGFFGTSASAPFVSGVAALLLSRSDALTPEDVRGLLIASAEDLGARGWDDRYGAGLLRADNALRLEYPSTVRILSPRTDAGTNAQDVVVIGTVASPLMTGYRVMYGVGVNPQRWTDITADVPRQVIADTLCRWDVSALADTTYTLRLAALTDKGITLDDRVVLHLDRTPPVIESALLVPALDGPAFGVSVGFITDEATLGKVWYRLEGSSDPWNWVSAEGATRNNLFVGTAHAVFLGADLFLAGRSYEFYLSAENAVGLETIARDTGNRNFRITVPAPVSSIGPQRVLPSLPVGRVFGASVDFNRNGRREILLNNLAEDGRFEAWEYNGTGFERVDNGALGREIPRGVGDIDGDGQPELLTSLVRNGFLYRTSAVGVFPDQRIWGDSVGGDFWPIGIVDATGDGANEVLAVRNDSTIGVYRWDGSALALYGDITNPTAPRGRNSYSAPRAAVGDFNSNGAPDLLFGDADGDFFIVEHEGGGRYRLLWASEDDFIDASDFVAAGDFNGDGRDEFAIGFRTATDDVVPFWFFGVYALDAQNKARHLWTGQFHGVTESSQYGSFTRIQNSLTAGNIDDDAADELLISVFPDLYVLEYDAGAGDFDLTWHLPLVNTNAVWIGDANGNGTPDFALALPDSIVWYERDVRYAGPPPVRGVDVEYSNHFTAEIRWQVVEQSPQYRVYKGPHADAMELFGTFSASLPLSDPSLVEGTTVLYAVAGYDPARTPAESPRVYTRLLRPHARPRVDTVGYAGEGQLKLQVSNAMGTTLPSPSRFLLNGSRQPLSVALLDEQTLLLSFGTLREGQYGLQLVGLRDGEGVPFADEQYGPIEVREQVDNSCYIERVEYLPPRSFAVYFSAAMDPVSAAVAENYVFSPAGKVLRAVPDPADARVVRIEVAADAPIGALGREYVLAVRNLRCASGAPLGEGAGSTAGVVLNRQNLDDMFVYPNPLQPSDGQEFITFANLTARATIRIYTVAGMFIREVEEKDGNGGVEWDLRDEQGGRVPGGVYIYHARGFDAQGREVEAVVGKFAIIR